MTPKEALHYAEIYGSINKAAEALGKSRSWMQGLVRQAKASRDDTFRNELPPVELLIEERKRKFQFKQQLHEDRKIITIPIKEQGPIGIIHFGDPHVDDDGTDIAALERHTGLVASTEGLYGANLGDTTNCWTGRLARLYSQQSTSAAEAWQLAEWFLRRIEWLYVIGGNHDLWAGAGDPMKWILNTQSDVMKSSEMRIKLAFPNKREVRINAHHDYKGTSQWNPAHGSMKAAQMGFRDHILINGHKHTSGYGVVKCPSTGVISHCIQVGSYKIYDRFAEEKGFRDQHISPSVVTIIDPEASEAGLVTVFHEVDEAVDFLKWKRCK